MWLNMESRCHLGELLNDHCCNRSRNALTEEERVLLNLRTGHSVTTVCDAHRTVYLKLYVLNQKKCCDPHGIHKNRSVTRGLKVISVSMALKQRASGLNLVPGKKLCTSCRRNLSLPQLFLDNPSDDEAADDEAVDDEASDDDTSKEPSDDDFGAQEDVVTSRISSLLVSLDQSPIDKMKLRRKRYAEDDRSDHYKVAKAGAM